MWTNQKVEYPEVKPGSTLTSEHSYIGNKKIKSATPSCGCIKIRRKDNILTARWETNKNVDESYVSYKYITIVYHDNSIDEIELKANITV